MAEAPPSRKTFPSLRAGIGTGGAVLAAAAIGVVLTAGAASFDVQPRATSTLVDGTGELGAPPGPRVVRIAPAPAPAPASGIAVASIPSPPASPDGGPAASVDPDRLAPKLGNSGIDAGGEPAPGDPGPSEGAPGPPGGSGIAGEDEGPSVEDVSRPIYGPADPPSAAPTPD